MKIPLLTRVLPSQSLLLPKSCSLLKLAWIRLYRRENNFKIKARNYFQEIPKPICPGISLSLIYSFSVLMIYCDSWFKDINRNCFKDRLWILVILVPLFNPLNWQTVHTIFCNSCMFFFDLFDLATSFFKKKIHDHLHLIQPKKIVRRS